MPKRILPLSKVYRLLEPGPVVLVTTAGKNGPNVMTLSWHMMMEFEPPLVACLLSNRNYSFELLKRSRECVINIPTVELSKQVVGCGNTTGRTTDKFSRFGLTPTPATFVKAPLIRECYANLECKLVDATLTSKYNMFILQVLRAWIERGVKNPQTMHHMGRGAFMIAGDLIRLPSKMK